jgi:hypothetical protein
MKSVEEIDFVGDAGGCGSKKGGEVGIMGEFSM